MRVIGLAVLIVLALLSPIFPVFRLPQPTGPLAVGTTIVTLGGPEALALQIWYPAKRSASDRTAPYEPVTSGLRNRVFRMVRTAAALDAPLSAGNTAFPVLIYVNSWGGTRWENTALMQELASHGFVVAASDQPTGMVDGVDLSDWMDYSSPEAHAKTMRLIPVKLREQVRTASRVMDRLANLDADPASRFTGRLDLSRAGILGFSFGGATAAEAVLADQRFRAAMNMDGLTFGEASARGVPYPYLNMSDSVPLPGPAELASSDPAVQLWAQAQVDDDIRNRANLARNGAIFVTVLGTIHPNFSDYPMLVPFRRLSGAGPVDPQQAGRIIEGWAVGFFRNALAGGKLPPLKNTAGVTVESWPPLSRHGWTAPPGNDPPAQPPSGDSPDEARARDEVVQRPPRRLGIIVGHPG